MCSSDSILVQAIVISGHHGVKNISRHRVVIDTSAGVCMCVLFCLCVIVDVRFIFVCSLLSILYVFVLYVYSMLCL